LGLENIQILVKKKEFREQRLKKGAQKIVQGCEI
jgi:hypothetical protein